MIRQMINCDYISLGAGVQSSALIALAERGKIKVKGAIFADTGEEPKWVYDYLNLIKKRAKLPIHTCRSHYENLTKFTFEKKFVSAPVYSIGATPDMLMKKSMGMRQCTTLFKIQPVLKKMRELENKVRVRLPARAIKLGLGISIDEKARAKPSRTRWIDNIFPLLELGLSRKDCEKLCEDYFGYTPFKSSCTFCPYKSKADFKFLKKHDPTGFKKACEFDDKIRNLKKRGAEFCL